jgi:hypothetical protein
VKRIKNLGLAAVAVLALSAIVGISSAAATGFMSSAYPATLKGVATGTLKGSFPGAGTIECLGPELQATANAASETLTTSVGDGLCVTGEMMKSHGCQFIFHPGTKSLFNGSFDIGPAGCGPITIGDSTTACEFKIGAQSGLAANYANVGSGATATVTIEAQASALKYTRSGACGAGTFSNGTLTDTWKLEAEKGGKQVGTHVAADNGLWMAGKSPSVQLAAEGYPAGIVGSSSLAKWTYPKLGQTECEVNRYTAELPGTVTEISLQAAYSECESLWQESVVSMNSCRYLAHIPSSGPPYLGSVDLVCNTGDAIKVTVGSPKFTVCTLTVPAQPLGAATFENKGEGTGRYVVANVSDSALKYSFSGSLCGTGSGENGIFSSIINLKALR